MRVKYGPRARTSWSFLVLSSVLLAGASNGVALAAETPGDMSLSGNIIALTTDGRPLEERRYAQVSVHGLDDDVFETASGSPFTFDGLTTGNRYVVAAMWSNPYSMVYAGGSPDEAHARVFTAATTGIRIEQPVGGLVTGNISYAEGWLPAGLEVTAYRLDPKTERYEWASFAESGGGQYTFEALFPGTYIFRGKEQWQIEGRTAGDRYWPGVDNFDDAEPVVVASGQSRVGLNLELGRYRVTTSRIAGSDRYETSVLASERAFSSGVPVVYLASGANWPDALSAAPAAARRDGALLLTAPSDLPAVVRDEIRRLAPAEVVVVGSDASVSERVIAQLDELVPSVRRIGGVDRFETSRLIVEDAFGSASRLDVLLATGLNFPDALSAAPIAGSNGGAVLLVNGSATSLDDATESLLRLLQPRATEVIGGYPSVTRELELDLIASGVGGYVAHRDAGVDRYDTSERLSSRMSSGPTGIAFLATGATFADALGAATAATNMEAPIILTPPNCVRSSALDGARSGSIDRLILLGSESTLGSGVQQLLRCP